MCGRDTKKKKKKEVKSINFHVTAKKCAQFSTCSLIIETQKQENCSIKAIIIQNSCGTYLLFQLVVDPNQVVRTVSKKKQQQQIKRFSWLFLFQQLIYNPGQNVLGHLRKLGTKTHFAKLTRILPLKKAWRCCYKGLFVLSPSPPSSVDCVELKLQCITPTLHRGGRGEGRCLNLTSYCVSVPRVLTRVV